MDIVGSLGLGIRYEYNEKKSQEFHTIGKNGA